ncbi:VPLPA-CTERM sorting domain-containing protein [Hwanghaeella grinnelliae]|nr:VPLPA-CTERM sorting domain-containing protein [Hwanghaeella grinnelliae]
MQKFFLSLVIATATLTASSAQATFVSLGDCDGAIDCFVTATPPNPIIQNPNDGILLAWNEVQNFELTQDLRVDRVFDPNASFVEALSGGDFLIKAGTIVSSHYLQWDPGNGSDGRVSSTIELDSQVFAFITADNNLFNSDFLGLAGLDYADFGFRGLESGDTTVFNGTDVDISWAATSPGDWTRLITAFSPGGVTTVPVPAAAPLLGLGLAAFGLLSTRRRKG